MGDIAVTVRLKAPDPEAMTALSTMRRIHPDSCPDVLERYDYWCFLSPADGEGTVTEIVSHFHDLVNPNKHTWRIEGECGKPPRCTQDRTWVCVLVTDRTDSISENWTGILKRKGYGIGGVRYSVLWCLGFPPSTDLDDAVRMAEEISNTSHRDSGLLANPVFQRIQILSRN